MRELRATAQLCNDLTDDQVADIIWSLNAPGYYVLLVRERHWTSDTSAEWLTDAFRRLLLKP